MKVACTFKIYIAYIVPLSLAAAVHLHCQAGLCGQVQMISVLYGRGTLSVESC